MTDRFPSPPAKIRGERSVTAPDVTYAARTSDRYGDSRTGDEMRAIGARQAGLSRPPSSGRAKKRGKVRKNGRE